MRDPQPKSKRPTGEPAQGRGTAAWVPNKPDARGAPPARLGELLVGAQEVLAQKTFALMTHDQWRGVVGPKIASRTRVGRLSRGVLTVHVASSSWSSELTFLQTDLLQKLAQRGYEVTRLRFQVDQALSNSQEQRGPAPSTAVRNAGALPPDLEARLMKIEDPNLRAAVAEAARWSLSRRR